MSDASEKNEIRENGLPRPSDIRQEIFKKTQDERLREEAFNDEFSRLSVKGERQYLHLKGLEDHYFHKKLWSYFIAGLMAVMILFQSTLLWFVGIGTLSFEKYSWLLPALLVQNLGQIVGLAAFVVKALFAKMEEE